MPNVLILGGTGYLGLSLGQSLVRSGNYAVWGLTRSLDKAKILAANEITPIIGDVSDPSTIVDGITSTSIDIVVDTTSAYEQASTILNAVISAAKARTIAFAQSMLSAQSSASSIPPAHGLAKGITATVVDWRPVHKQAVLAARESIDVAILRPSAIYGRVSDLSPVGNSLAKGITATVVDWRPVHEQAVLAARESIDVAILRPSAIYGRASWVWGTWWAGLLAAKQSGSSEAIKVPADREARTGTVHVDDVVTGFHAAIDRIDGRLGSWPVFDLLGETISVVEIMESVKATLGVKAPIHYIGTHGNPFLDALSLVTNSDSSRARTVLGWEAKHKEFLLNMPVYINAWIAAQESVRK